MTAKATWTWTTVAVGLFAFIYFFERHLHVVPSGPARVLPALRASAVTSIRVVPKGQLEIRADRTNGIWVLTKPVNSPAENTAINALVQALEHMTPAILLTDGYLGFGSTLFRIPKMADMPEINPPIAEANDPNYKPYRRDPETLVRKWAIPGTEGLRHRIGGLEKENITGTVSTDPMNHQIMTDFRAAKVEKVADFIPEQEIDGPAEGDLLVISWGGTYGAVHSAVSQMQKEGRNISHAHFHYIMPLPKNTEKVLKGFKKIVVCELNSGQFVNYLRMKFPMPNISQFNKVQGLPFMINELTDKFNQLLEEK